MMTATVLSFGVMLLDEFWLRIGQRSLKNMAFRCVSWQRMIPP